MKTKKSTIIYLRVSTAEQETDSQEHQILEFCRVRGWDSPLILRDAAIEGGVMLRILMAIRLRVEESRVQ